MQSTLVRLARISGNRLASRTIQDKSSRPCLSLIRARDFSSNDTPDGKYAVINHSEAYEQAMQGLHGKQLALARLEGVGKDDPPFDPFLEDELLEELNAAEEGEKDDDEYDDIEEAELVENEESFDDYEDFEEEDESPYNRDGSVRRKMSVKATLRAGFPAGGLFAVIQLSGIQHKVAADDLVVCNRLQPVEKFKIGSVHTLSDVLLVGSSHMTLVGMPIVSGAEVDVMVEEITRDAKVIVFKKRRRKHSERRNGFRRDVTFLRILDIRFPEEYKDHNHVGREILEELEETTKVSAGKQEVTQEAYAEPNEASEEKAEPEAAEELKARTEEDKR
jgi:large subunit ribosomal protein L21